PMGASVEIHFADFVFEVRMVAAGKAPPHKLADDVGGKATYFALTAISMASLMFATAFLVPPLGITYSERLDHERMILIQQYLTSAAEREQESLTASRSEQPRNENAGTGARATGAEGMIGKE